MSSRVSASGPLFDGRAERAIRDFCDDLTDTVAEEGRVRVLENLSTSLQHPTGNYERHITVDNVAHDHAQVTDDGVVYGPWLEGESSRNRTTRFRGYSSFRRAAQATDRSVRVTAQIVLAKYIRRMQ
jgi:hypothetical protein